MKTHLRPFCEVDRILLETWMANGAMDELMSRWSPHAAHVINRAGDLCRWSMIVSNGRSIGTVWIERRSTSDQAADLGILIGDAQDRGSGRGSEAIRLAEREVIDAWNLSLLRLRVRASNLRAIRCYERCGFASVKRTSKVSGRGFIHVVHMEHDLRSLQINKGIDPKF